MATAQEVGRLIVRLVGDGKAYQAMLLRARDQTKAFAVRASALLKTVGASMRSLGRTMALRVTLPLVIMGGLAVNAFAKFDKAMIESTSIMQVTTEQMERMRKTALSLSTSGQGAQGAAQLAESYFFLASAGKDAEQSIALLSKVQDFATAGAFDMALATDLLTDAQSALGLSVKNVAQDTENMVRLSDVLVKANTLANASVQQFSTALTSKAASAMKAFNIPMEQGVAVLAAFADQGIKAELAGNSFSRMMLLMSKASRDNQAAFKRLNFQLFDTEGAVRPMGDLIANLETSLEGMSAKAKTAALAELGFNARVQGAILPLLGTSDAIKRYTKELEKAGGITKEVAEKQMKSFSNQMKVFRNRVAAVGIEIGKTLAPMLTKITKLVERGTAAWKNLSPAMKQLSIIAAVVAAAMGPVLIIVGMLATAIGAIISPVGLVVAGIAALAAGIVTLQVKFSLFSPVIRIVKALWESLTLVFDIVKPLTVLVTGPLTLAFKTLGFVLESVLVPVLDFIANRLEELADNMKTVAKATKEATANFFTTIPEIEAANKQLERATKEREKLIAAQEEAMDRIEEINRRGANTISGGAGADTGQGFFGQFFGGGFGIQEQEAAGPILGPFKNVEESLAQAKDRAKAFNIEMAKTAQLAAEAAEAGERFETAFLSGALVESAAADRKIRENAEAVLATLEKQKAIVETSAEAVALKELAEDGVNETLVEQIRLAQEALGVAKETVKAKKDEARAMENVRKEAEGLIKRFRTPAKEFQDAVASLEKQLSMDLIDKGTFDRALDFATERFQQLQDMATIRLRVISPRDATQLGTAEAERRLEEFRNAVSGGGKAVLPGPQLPPGARFQAPDFRAGGRDGLQPGEPNFAETFQEVEVNKTLDMIAGFMKRVADGTDVLVEKDPVEIEEVSI